MSWFLAQNRSTGPLVLGIKEKLAVHLGPVIDFCESKQGKEIINVRCVNGGKAIKIANFSKEKSIDVFSECTSAANFKAQLKKVNNTERSSAIQSERQSSNEASPSFQRSSTQLLAAAPSDDVPATPGVIPNGGPDMASSKTPEGTSSIIPPIDTPCTTKKIRSVRKRKLQVSDAVDMIHQLPQEDVLSPLQRRFEECKVGKSEGLLPFFRMICTFYLLVLPDLSGIIKFVDKSSTTSGQKLNGWHYISFEYCFSSVLNILEVL